jgi:hypothetical protein
VRVTRVLTVLATVAIAALTATPASAEPYPVGPPAAAVSAGTVGPGGVVVFSGSGFVPGETISITVDYSGNTTAALRTGATGAVTTGNLRGAAAGQVVTSRYAAPVQVATTTASVGGSFSVSVQLTQPGIATLVGTGLTSGVTVAATVRVLAPVANRQGGDELAVTGMSRLVGPAVAVGVATLLVGAVVVWLATGARRRRVGRP